MPHQRRLAAVRTWFWFIVMATFVGGLVAFVASSTIPPTYVSRATILVSPTAGTVQIGIGEIDVARAAAATFSELATTRPVLTRAIKRSGVATDVDALEKAVTTRVPVVTSLLEISVTSRSGKDAASLANAIAAELVAYPTGTGTDGGAAWNVVVDVVDPAVEPLGSEGLGRVLTTALAAGAAFLIAVSLAFLVENLRSDEDAPPDRLPPDPLPARGSDVGASSSFDERGEVGRLTG